MKELARKIQRVVRRLVIRVRSTTYRLLLAQCGGNLMVYGRIDIKSPELVEFGHNCRVNEGTVFLGAGRILIGSHVHISAHVLLSTSGLDYRKEGWPKLVAPITIGDFAWLAAGAKVRPGVAIGEGAIIGMGAVVTENVPPYTVYAGVPAKKIGEIPNHRSCTCATSR